MNRMINHLTDTNLRAFNSTLDKKMRAMIEAQHDLLDQLNESTEESERAQIKSSFRNRQEAMQKTMDEWNNFTGNINSRLSIMDRKASDVLYWNRRRNLKDLEREARYRFDDIADEAESMSKKISKNFNEIAESLRDWTTALNVDQLASGLEESQQSMRDLRIDIQKHMKMSNEEWSKLRDEANKFSADTGYSIENTKYVEGYASLIKSGYSKDIAKDLAGYLAKMDDMTGVDASSMEKFLQLADDSRIGPQVIKDNLSALMKIQQDLQVEGSTMTSFLEENSDVLGTLAKTPEQYQEYLRQGLALSAASSASFLPDLDTKLMEIMKMTPDELGENPGLAYIDAQGIQKKMLEGDFKSASEMYVKGMQGLLKDFSNDPITRDMYLKELGVELDDKLKNKLLDDETLKKLSDNFDRANNDIQEDRAAPAGQKFGDTWKPEKSLPEQIANMWKASEIGGAVDDFCNALGMSSTELLASAYFLKNLAGGLGGPLGKLGGKAFTWLRGTGVGKAVGAGLAKAGGVAKEGLSKGAAAAGNIAKSGASKAGGFLSKASGFLTNPAVLSKLNAAGAIAFLGYNAYEGADKAKDWLGDDSTGSKVAAGIGGALGGTGPGLLDEGSATDKAMGVAGGAMKGAMIGSLILPGVGTAVGAALGGTLSAIGGENIAKFISSTGTTISEGWDSFTDWGGNAIDSLGTKFNNTWNSIGQWGSSTWDSLSTSAGEVSDSIRQGMSNAWESISTFISDKVKSLGEVMNSTWDSTINFFSGIFQGFFDGIKSKFAWIIDPIRKVYDKITGNGKKPGTPGTPGTPGIPREKSIFDKAKDAIKDTTVGRIATGIADTVGSFFEGDKSTNPATPTESSTPNSIQPDGSHAYGLNYVPFDGYLAELHKGEAVLNSFQADYWRNHMPQASANSETWTPNDNSGILDSSSLAKVNNNYNNTNNESSNNSSNEISSNDDVVQAIQWLCRELKTAIMQDNASSSSTTNMMMQYLMRNTGKEITPSDQVFSFVR